VILTAFLLLLHYGITIGEHGRCNSFERREQMATKKVDYNKSGIEKLPDDKPTLYRIQTEGGKENYVGVAQRGRVRERITEHLGRFQVPRCLLSNLAVLMRLAPKKLM